MNAFQDFMIKVAALYLAAPAFFNWAAPLLVTIILCIVWFAFWLGGQLSKSKISELKGKVDVLEQRVIFAKDRADAATKDATEAKTDLEKLKKDIARQASKETLQNSASVLGINLDRVLSANNSTSAILGYVSTGFNEHGGLNWRPVGEDEKHLIAPLSRRVKMDEG